MLARRWHRYARWVVSSSVICVGACICRQMQSSCWACLPYEPESQAWSVARQPPLAVLFPKAWLDMQHTLATFVSCEVRSRRTPLSSLQSDSAHAL
ncbi:hypothetical protein C8Q73DRAFT_373336 [Cubamyces lactineus]|nr:hypothetical protein C8Q73DRAFT_373336 [Cubamyces lactineus]